MRVLFLVDAVVEDMIGGSRCVAQALAQGLVSHGHAVTFLAPRCNPHSRMEERHPNGVRIVRYAGAGKTTNFLWAGYAACKRLWAEQPFDIVHTHFAYAAFGPMLAIPSDVPSVRTFHGPWHEEGWISDMGQGRLGIASRLKARLRRRIRFEFEAINLRQSSAVTTLSDSFQSYVTENFGVAESRIQVIQGGVDNVRFTPSQDKPETRKRLGLPQDRKILLSVRRLTPRMGLDNLISAMPQILERNPDTLLLIGGKGPQRADLQHLIGSMDLTKSVRLVGRIPEEQLAAYYQAADLFVLPTTALEGFGLVTLEALSSGVPVIGTAVGATPEILRRLDARLIAPEPSARALAESINHFWAGDWRLDLTPERLHAFACNNFSWANHVHQMERFYQEAIDRNQDGRQAPGRCPQPVSRHYVTEAVSGLRRPVRPLRALSLW